MPASNLGFYVIFLLVWTAVEHRRVEFRRREAYVTSV